MECHAKINQAHRSLEGFTREQGEYQICLIGSVHYLQYKGMESKVSVLNLLIKDTQNVRKKN